MTESILSTTKKILGVAEDYTVFDIDIITHINSVFSDLQQLGVGPVEGYQITSAADTWDAFYQDPNLNSVRTYVYLRVRLLFDPPGTSYLQTALEEQVKKMEWRLNVYVDSPFNTIEPEVP